MSYYGMSETGHCNRVLSAIKLNEPAKQRSDMDEDRLEHYSRLEAVAAEKLEKEGFEVLDSGECKICNNGRCGWHIEIEEGLFKLVGHLDRRVNIPDILILKQEDTMDILPAMVPLPDGARFHILSYIYRMQRLELN